MWRYEKDPGIMKQTQNLLELPLTDVTKPALFFWSPTAFLGVYKRLRRRGKRRIHTHTHTHTHRCAHIPTCTYIHIHMHAHIHTHTHTHGSCRLKGQNQSSKTVIPQHIISPGMIFFL